MNVTGSSDDGAFSELSGYYLSSIESPGYDYLCLTFEAHSGKPTAFLYLYGSFIAEADFTCEPFFPATSNIRLYNDLTDDGTLNGMFLDIIFNFKPGLIRIRFREFSLHVLNEDNANPNIRYPLQ